MTVLIILALAAVPCWLLWSHIKQTKIEDAARPKGNPWEDPIGGGELDEPHEDDLEKPKAKKVKVKKPKTKKPKAKTKTKKKTGAKRGRPRKKKDPEKDVGEK